MTALAEKNPIFGNPDIFEQGLMSEKDRALSLEIVSIYRGNCQVPRLLYKYSLGISV